VQRESAFQFIRKVRRPSGSPREKALWPRFQVWAISTPGIIDEPKTFDCDHAAHRHAANPTP